MKNRLSVALWLAVLPLRAQMSDSGMYLMNMASGTSMNPESWSMPMIMKNLGHSWQGMFMGQAFVVDTQQSGPRGGDKFYSPNWFMGSFTHPLGGGTLAIGSMVSLDPATVTNRSYPLLFQTGETAYGRPLVDAQHPHDLIMSIGLDYVHMIGSTKLQLYYAPVGDPALGPVAFPHRASAFELPQATLSHHWQDSTHIADNVATVALARGWWRAEASGFYGSEPDENRWNIDWGPMNSYAGRFSVMPSSNWVFQVSAGRLTRPERQEPGDVVRATASAHYTRGGWSSSLIWGRNHQTLSKSNSNSYVAETLVPVGKRDFVTGRIELVDKNELEIAGSWRIQAYTAGMTHDLGTFHHVETGVGANVTAYGIPGGLKAAYGDHPFGVNIYLRLRLKM